MLTNLQKQTAQAIVNIFETGEVRGDYGRVTLLPGDPGHLTYGRSQTTLASGNLYLLIRAYVEAPGAAFASRLRGYLSPFAACDTALDSNQSLRTLLRDAGADLVMQEVQDQFFDRVYWAPGIVSCGAIGIESPLGAAVVYDSRVHGSWAIVRDRTAQRHGPVSEIGERTWVDRYVMERRNWLANHSIAILHKTVYRMDAFRELISDDDWDLPLPLRVRGIAIDEDALHAATSVPASAGDESERILLLRSPALRGPDVKELQETLAASGFPVKASGVFGSRTASAVRAFQRSRGLREDGIVGPVTRCALGL